MKTIKVTQKHINVGLAIRMLETVDMACHCPVAMALKEAGYARPAVDGDTIMTDETRGNAVETPKTVKRFIEKFDANKKVKPFSFKLDI